MNNILITLCARGGSKGIPKKNIKELNNVPLIAYTIKHAQEFSKQFSNVDIELSTDDQEIINIAEKYGLKTLYERPAYLATDTIGKIDVISDLLFYKESITGKKYEFILDLDISSPLRTIEDLEEAYVKILKDKEAYNLFSVSEPYKNPYFNVVEKSENGYYNLVKKSTSLSRQTAPKVYDMNASFYFYRRSFFEKGLKSAITDQSLIYLMDHICFDLDEPFDFEIMEILLSTNKLDFKI